MTLNVLFSVDPSAWPEWQPHLLEAFAVEDLNVTLTAEAARPEEIDYVIYAPSGSLQDFARFTRTKAVMSLWAGVESIVGNQSLTQPLTRMVDPGLTEGMVEWVVGHTLRHHLLIDTQLLHQDGNWRPVYPPLARDRSVTILGLGALGTPCAEALTQLNFSVAGWSRTPKNVPGIRCLSGDDGFADAIATAQILVLLLPSTPQTQNILGARALAGLPQGLGDLFKRRRRSAVAGHLRHRGGGPQRAGRGNPQRIALGFQRALQIVGIGGGQTFALGHVG